MKLQRQHFLLSYLETLSVGSVRIWTHDLPHTNPILSQQSKPVSGLLKWNFRPALKAS